MAMTMKEIERSISESNKQHVWQHLIREVNKQQIKADLELRRKQNEQDKRDPWYS